VDGDEDMLKVMQIGYGYWGTNVTRKLLNSDMFELKYLVESDEKRISAAKEVIPAGVSILKDYKEGLNGEIDAVVICTQTEYSFAIAMDAMKEGKHVFTEKPLATNMDRAKKMVNYAKENGLILHCDHLMVYNPVIKYIKKMIDSGELGNIMYIDISRVNLGPIRKDINAMLDLAVHDIAVIDYLLDGISPNQLNVYGTKFFGNQDTITYLSMKCDETLININSSWVSPVKVRRTLIGGTKKMVIFDDVKPDDKLTIYDCGINVTPGSEYGEYEYKTRTGDIFMPHIPFEDALQNSLEHFAYCVENKEDSLSGPNQSLRVMDILEKAQNMLKQ